MVGKQRILNLFVALALFSLTAVADSRPQAVKQAPDAATSETSGLALVRQVLCANGETGMQLARGERAYREFAGRFLAKVDHTLGEREQATAIHRFVHEEILAGPYETSASDLGVTLGGGPYNCLTASVLFLALARDRRLPAEMVAVPGHVWCRIEGTERFDVETTCAAWFDWQTVGERLGNEIREILAAHEQRAREARPVSDAALVAIVHYNRGVRLLREERFADAAQANLEAMRWDRECQPARDNLLATINNWSLALASEGKRPLGLELLEWGMAFDADYEPFQANYRFLTIRTAR